MKWNSIWSRRKTGLAGPDEDGPGQKNGPVLTSSSETHAEYNANLFPIRYRFLTGSSNLNLFILGSLENAYSELPIGVNWTFLLDATAEALPENISWKSAILLQ